MRHYLLVFLVFTIVFENASGQELVIPKTIDVTPLYSKVDTFKVAKIDFEMKSDSTITVTDVELVLESLTVSAPIKFVNSKIKIPKIKSGDSLFTVSVFLIIPGSKKNLKGDELARIFLKSDKKKSKPIYVRFTERGLYTLNKPFWIEVGSNFDLIDGLQPNNFFSGVFLHQVDVRPFSLKCKKEKRNQSKKLGIFAGVYESKTISVVGNDALGVKEYYNQNSLHLVNPKVHAGEFGGFRDSARIKTNQVVRNLGLFLSPQVRLTNGSAKADGLHLFASLWVELQWQRIELTRDYTGLSRADTFSIPKSSLFHYIEDPDNKLNSTTKTTLDLKSHYYGFGLPIKFKEGTTNVFINPVIGFSNQPRLNSDTAELASLLDMRTWGWFYVIQFRLSEEQYGISFTGEIRGLTQLNSPPFISLALSKKFDLTKFLEFSKD